MEFKFSKYCGLGNHFVFIDNRDKRFPIDSSIMKRLCNPHFGIGADGIILVEDSSLCDYKMRIFNSDGSEAEMCGNGLRCYYKFLKEIGCKKESFLIETMNRALSITSFKGEVRSEMGAVPPITWGLNLDLKNKFITGHFLDTGVPHFVIVCDHVDQEDVVGIGREIRQHPYFHPKGTNVNFISMNNGKEVRVRTYERGVENETAACGTGSAAAAIVASKIYSLKPPVTVLVSNNERLKFDFSEHSNIIKHLEMIGDAKYIFKGAFSL